METSKQSGSSLVEVMVALFVLAIGLLGVLALQAKSMRFNQSAHSYSQAVYLANSLAERVSVNPSQASEYEKEDADATVSASTECDSQGCTAQQLAQWDLKHWIDEITETLPAGKGVVEPVPDADPTHLRITVSFDDSRSDSREPGEAVDGTVDNNYTGRQEYSILVGL